MKKVIISLILVLATGTSFMNANSINTKNISSVKNISLEDFGCLTRAYNFANFIEAFSPGGAYSYSIEEWSSVFNSAFERCNADEDNFIDGHL